MMYKEAEAEARVVGMSPILRGLAEEMLRRGKQFDHRVPLDEALDGDLEEQLRLARIIHERSGELRFARPRTDEMPLKSR
jgi:hypothetical protein